MVELQEIMKLIYKNKLEFEVYSELHPFIMNRYNEMKYENICRKTAMHLARKLNRNKNKDIDIALDEATLYDE